jgi:23S rRNA pseudouridine1911/1915/1917 synthase
MATDEHAAAVTAAMKTRELRVPTAAEGLRVDQHLARVFSDRSRAGLQRLIQTGHVRLNGQPCRRADKLRANDRIEIEFPAESPRELVGEAIPLNILFEDDDILVLNKPPGLVVHPAKGHMTGTLVHALLSHDEEHFGDLAEDDQRPGIVHRLDKDTSGVMVVAKTAAAWTALKTAFRERTVEKTYLALVLGEFGVVTGEVRAPIGRHPVQRQKMAVLKEGGRPAITKYRVLESNGEVSLMQVRIETGRTHQIRVHFANLHHPVAGDPVYGGRQRDLPIRVDRQMLHAWRLVFPHPRTGVMREYMAPVPEDFRTALVQLGFRGLGPGQRAPHAVWPP